MRKLALCFLVGCGSSATVDSGFKPQSGTHAEEGTFPTLSEWNALTVEANEEMRDAGSNDQWDLLTTHIRGLVQVVKNGEKPELRFQPCSIALPEVAGIQPTLPDTTVQAAGFVPVAAQWAKVDDKFQLNTPEWASIVFGAKLAAPLTDALPTNKNDARVQDLDDDGKPGVTMKASIGRLYMVMRGQTKLAGIYDPATGGMSGTAEYKRDFYIFGDNVFGVAKKTVDSTYEKSETRPAQTTGTLMPLKLAHPTCDDVP